MPRLMREPTICIWNYLTKPFSNPRHSDPDWIFDPDTTEVHLLLTAEEAAVPGRVKNMQDRGYVVGCRNTWWLAAATH